MQRPASPLLHDYKPSPHRAPAKSKAIQWFAVGLGIPLIAVLLASLVRDDTSVREPPAEPALVAADDTALDLEINEIQPLALPAAEAIAPPEPQFDTLTLTVGRGDTMDSLFRRNQLDIAELLAIARLDEAKQRFRRIRPGDTFEVTHDGGNIVSLYSELSLTSALDIRRTESGFTAEIVERPIEKRKRMAYGVIDTSLFESAADGRSVRSRSS